MQSNRESERALETVEDAIAVLEGLRARQGVPVGDVVGNLRRFVIPVLRDLDDEQREAECSWCGGPCKVGGPILAPVQDRWSGTAVGLGLGVSAVSDSTQGSISR